MTGRDLDQLAVRVRPVLRLAVPDPRRLVARPSVLDLVGAQRRLAADHDQGARRLVEALAAGPDRDARLRRGAVRRPDRRAPDAAQGPAHRRRDRHHAAARAARGAAGRARRPDPPVPRPRRRPTIVFRDELETLARARGARSTTSSGRAAAARTIRSTRPSLARLVPDIRERDVYLCGPVADDAAGRGALRGLGLPRGQIHAERFAY